jgi:uncharacterized protein (DUF58 family)
MDAPSLQIEAVAEKWAQGVPRPSYRLARTETMWFYRAYQGGEPYTSIDWRQSGRTEALLVREHETIHQRPLFLWTSSALDNCEAQCLLLALARLLMHDGREVGWLSASCGLTSQIARLEEQYRECEAAEDIPYLQEARLPKMESCVVFAAPFALEEDVWAARLKLFAAQGASGVLVDQSSPSLARESALLTRARNLDWPVLSLPPAASAEPLLPDLHEQVLRLTL